MWAYCEGLEFRLRKYNVLRISGAGVSEHALFYTRVSILTPTSKLLHSLSILIHLLSFPFHSLILVFILSLLRSPGP